jgi:replicative DNA helicase
MELLNAIIEHDDIAPCLERNIQNVFDQNINIYNYILDYVSKYKTIPTKNIVKQHFSEFELLNTKDAPLEYYIDEAIKQSLAKNVRQNLAKAIELLGEAGPMAAMNHMTSSSNKLMRENGILKDTNLSTDYQERIEDFKTRYTLDKHMMGVPSLIKPIDEIFGGWQAGDFAVLMGWTGSKKTWLALLFACNAWRSGYTPLIISLEMNKFQMGFRLDTILNNGERFTNDDLTHARGLEPTEYEAWAEKTFADAPPFYLVTSEGIESANQYMVESKVDQYGPDLLILDYHGLFDDAKRGGTETEKAKNLSKDFKKLSVKYGVATIDIAAVTMNRGEQDDRPPNLDEVAWSKQLAYDADLVMAIHSPENSNISQIVSRKTRRCSPFAFYLDWDVNAGTWQEGYEGNAGSQF